MYQMPWRIVRHRAIVGHVTQTMRGTDKELQTTVTEELLYTPSIDATGVQVQARDGTVTLSGEVASLPERLAAERAAMRVRGVKAVQDKLVVHTSSAASASDDDIARAAGSLLEWAVDVPANAVQAGVRDHKITLSGSVTWEYQRDAAARAVMYIKGVTGIDNKISLNQPAPAAGTKAAVEAAMLRNAQLDARQITVDVSGSELTLHGTVGSWAEHRQAGYTAWAATGVTSVRNDLLVKS